MNAKCILLPWLSLVLVLVEGCASPSGNGESDASGTTVDAETNSGDLSLARPDVAAPVDAESAGDSRNPVDALDEGDEPDVDADAVVPGSWGAVPELCPNQRAYQAVREDAFELVSVSAGEVYGAGRFRINDADVLGVRDPAATELVSASSVYAYHEPSWTVLTHSTGGALGLEFWPRQSAPGLMFAIESNPAYPAPGCDGRGGAMIVAYERDDGIEPWAFTALGCSLYGTYWQRDHVLDSDGDGNPEILTGSPDNVLKELQPDGTFVELWRQGENRDYPRRVAFAGGLGSADLDGDGYEEFSVTTVFLGGPEVIDSRGAMQIFEYDPVDGYVARYQAIAPFYVPYWQAGGDVDGDGQKELLYGGPNNECRWLGLYHAVANDTYALKWGGAFHDPEGYEINEARMGDTDGDGDDEVILPSGCHVRVLEWDGTGLVQVADLPVGPHCDEPEAFPADLDGDGAAEIVITTRWSSCEFYVDPTGVAVWQRRRAAAE